MVNGQIRGAFVQALGAAIFEEFKYSDKGEFLSGTFADYLVPTVNEVPSIDILHLNTPSPFTPLGSKGVGEGNSMSTPVCIANAIADAIENEDIVLPMSPPKLLSLIGMDENSPKNLNYEIINKKDNSSKNLVKHTVWKKIKKNLGI